MHMRRKIRIHILGVTHTSKTDGEKIYRESRQMRPQAIFLERPVKELEEIGAARLFLCFTKNPVFLLSYIAYILFGSIIEKFRTGEFAYFDYIYANKASSHLQIPLYMIDDSIYEMIFDRHLVWSVLSWLIFILLITSLIFLIPSSIHIEIFLWTFFFIPISGLFSFYFVKNGVGLRNKHMLDRSSRIAEEKGYESVFLVTGKAHVNDLKEKLNLEYLKGHVE